MKKNIFHKLALVIIAIVSISGYSQEKKHEFSIAAGGMFSHIDYEIKDGNLDHGNGLSLGLRYSYYLNENWSLGLGAEYQSFNSTAKLDLASGNYMATDSEGETFEFRYNADNLIEKQSLKFINIPLNLQYEGADYPSFYASVGAKIGFSLKSTYETSIENLSTSGYYPQYDVELFDPRFAGFGNFGSISTGKQDIDLNVSYLATFEAGIKQFEDEGNTIYIGLYFDYGLNDILNKDSNKQIVEYPQNLPVNFKYNSILQSSYTDNVKIIAYGAKVRYAFW
jgi:hypothetical protein